MSRYLASQRALRGIGLDELSSLTKIPLRSLERLESGAFDGDADGFARGFVRTVALALGLDADEAVARLLREPAPDPVRAAGGSRGRVHALWLAPALLLGLLCAALLWPRDEPADPLAAAPAQEADVVYRSDAVRALAERHAASAAAATAPPPEVAPTP